MKAWWRHCLAAGLIGEHTAKLPIDHAYTAGLLHGVGQLALFERGGLDYVRLVNDSVSSSLDLQENERAAYGTDHAELAGLILEAWGLPESRAGRRRRCITGRTRAANWGTRSRSDAWWRSTSVSEPAAVTASWRRKFCPLRSRT